MLGVMLRDSAMEDGASRYEKHDTCEISRGHWQTVIRWGECVGRNLSQHSRRLATIRRVKRQESCKLIQRLKRFITTPGVKIPSPECDAFNEADLNLPHLGLA